MARVETSVGTSVLSYARDIVVRNDYNYYYLFSISPTDSYLIQSDVYNSDSLSFSGAHVIEFHFIHDDDDYLTDWRLTSYDVDLYYIDNSENYVVYTNVDSNYPVLRGDVRYVSAWYFAGLCVLVTALCSALFFFRIWRINHG